LLGVAHGAGGRYGAALEVLETLAAGPSTDEVTPYASVAASTSASVHRQLGRHAAGRTLDRRAQELAAGDRPARFDAELGLAADAVGLGEQAAARRHLDAAADVIGGEWRQRVRLDWVRAELALLVEAPATAVDAAAAAVRGAEREGAHRHLAKSLLFLGVAEAQSGRAAAVETLRRAAELACELGTRPLVWPACAVLATVTGDPSEAIRLRATAQSAIRAIGTESPESLAAEWFARPDIAALLRE
jgi:hypothetical protein